MMEYCLAHVGINAENEEEATRWGAPNNND